MERFCPHCEASYPADVKRCPADGTPTLIVSKDVWSRFKGRVLDDRWELGELIGQGGMGAVFRGTQIKLQRPVAVKILRKEIAGDRESIGRFFREAKILSKLQHPNIVTMLDFGQDEDTGSLYMVMELLQGRSLASWLATGEAISLRQILVMMEQLAFALSEAHEQEIVHRDLKPENLFLTRDANHLVVLDFGIAKVTDDSVTRLTRTGYIQGTPAYMSPEQAQGRQVGPPTDLYALGVLLYELLSGYEPFRATNVMQVLLQHISDPPKPLVDRWILAEPVNMELVELTHALLAKSPDDRPDNAAVLRHRLRALLMELDADAPPSVQRPRELQPPAPSSAPSKVSLDPWPRQSANLRPQRGSSQPEESKPSVVPSDTGRTSLAVDWPIVLAGAALVLILGAGGALATYLVWANANAKASDPPSNAVSAERVVDEVRTATANETETDKAEADKKPPSTAPEDAPSPKDEPALEAKQAEDDTKPVAQNEEGSGESDDAAEPDQAKALATPKTLTPAKGVRAPRTAPSKTKRKPSNNRKTKDALGELLDEMRNP